MTFRTAALAVATASVALLGAAAAVTAQAQAQGQTAPDSQWRTSPITLSTLLQDGYKIVAVVNDAHGNAGPADTIFVQRDQSAFKCIDPQQPDARAKTSVAAPACFELVPPSGTVPSAESK
ncbi:MAG TPA: hypothetical protein VGM85_00650 [Paraburkholderia sp.]|jgi:hypothetical protein